MLKQDTWPLGISSPNAISIQGIGPRTFSLLNGCASAHRRPSSFGHRSWRRRKELVQSSSGRQGVLKKCQCLEPDAVAPPGKIHLQIQRPYHIMHLNTPKCAYHAVETAHTSYPLVIKRDKRPSAIYKLFSQSSAHLVRAFPSQPCLMFDDNGR